MDTLNARSLQQIKNLSSFTLPQLEKLAANLTIRRFRRNDTIFDQGEEAKFVYLLLSGVVRLSYVSGNERETIVSLVPGGEFFGLDALEPKAHHPFRCDAFEDCSVGGVRAQLFIEILLGVSYEHFLRWYCAAIDPGKKMYVHCIRGIGLDLRRRLALELMHLAERFGKTHNRGVMIGINISHELLAGLVGASRQQVTEHVNELDREKVISRDGRRIIVNLPKLRRIVGITP
jgi:CRP-like cAMP-binding protein